MTNLTSGAKPCDWSDIATKMYYFKKFTLVICQGPGIGTLENEFPCGEVGYTGKGFQNAVHFLWNGLVYTHPPCINRGDNLGRKTRQWAFRSPTDFEPLNLVWLKLTQNQSSAFSTVEQVDCRPASAKNATQRSDLVPWLSTSSLELFQDSSPS